jgi:putative DNA primase/helicase
MRNDNLDFADAPQWLLDALRPKPAPTRQKPQRARPAFDTRGTPYGISAFEQEIARLAAAPDGTRNDTLNSVAFSLYQLVAGNELDGSFVDSELSAVAAQIGLTQREASTTIASARAAGMAEPRNAPIKEPPANVGRDVLPIGDEQTADELPENRTEYGVARRMVRMFGSKMRYVPSERPERRWYLWDGTRWQCDDTHRIFRYVEDTVKSLYNDAAITQDQKERTALVAFAMSCEAAKKMDSMVKLASRMGGIAITLTDFDRDQWKLNVLNGTIDLRTGE